MSSRIELAGKTLGGWSVLSYAGLNKHNQPSWNCRCICGTERIVVGQTLRNGDSVSCGCLKQKAISKKNTRHGFARSYKSQSRTYKAWAAMHNRCNGKEGTKFWENYGKNGIKVCEHWKTFENFLSDMGECPDGLSLDRVNSYMGYEKKNCRWATAKMQSNNRIFRRHRDLYLKALESVCMVV